MTFGQKSEWMKDPLVRQAITTAVDRDAIARAMIGKEEGDTAEVQTPGGTRRFEIVAVRYA